MLHTAQQRAVKSSTCNTNPPASHPAPPSEQVIPQHDNTACILSFIVKESRSLQVTGRDKRLDGRLKRDAITSSSAAAGFDATCHCDLSGQRCFQRTKPSVSPNPILPWDTAWLGSPLRRGTFTVHCTAPAAMRGPGRGTNASQEMHSPHTQHMHCNHTDVLSHPIGCCRFSV